MIQFNTQNVEFIVPPTARDYRWKSIGLVADGQLGPVTDQGEAAGRSRSPHALNARLAPLRLAIRILREIAIVTHNDGNRISGR